MKVDEIDEVIIGKQIWMTKNLGVTKFQNGDPIPEVLTKEAWDMAGMEGKPASCYYNNNPDNGVCHGVLYNWFAINDPRGLIPKGWRLPSPDDWNELIAYLGGKESAGKKMKSTNLWMNKENGNNGNGTNEIGFIAYPSGMRNFIGKFYGIGLSCGWWCAANKDEDNWLYYLDHDRDSIDSAIADKEDGASIRCIKE